MKNTIIVLMIVAFTVLCIGYRNQSTTIKVYEANFQRLNSEVDAWKQACRESEVRGNRLANDNRELVEYAGSLLSRQEQKKAIPQQKFVTRTIEGYDLPPLSPSPKEILEEADREWNRYTDQKIQRERNYLLREQIDNDNLYRGSRFRRY